ncbi:MAG: cyclic nucleotide-binding protein [Rhizobiales bacterium]|nr:cyclic nucleotide-binding protein [Hyphomicrobiales bacterium]
MDYVGYMASSLVFLTFYMKHMIPLRVVALFSNVAFLTYGIGMHLMPVALLHCALIPINLYRLVLAIRDDRRPMTGAMPTPSRRMT